MNPAGRMSFSWQIGNGVHFKFFFIIFQCIILAHLLIPNKMANDFQQEYILKSSVSGDDIDEIFEKIKDDNIINENVGNHTLLICYPSILHSPKFTKETESRQTQRFKIKINMKNGMCGNCQNCIENDSGIKWHMVELKWKNNKVQMRTFLLNGSIVDITEYVNKNFNGKIMEFLEMLTNIECKEEENLGQNNELIENGAFMEDLIADSSFNYFYYLKAIRMDFSKTIDFIEKNPNKKLKLFFTKNSSMVQKLVKYNEPPLFNETESHFDNATKLKICQKKIDKWNKEAGYGYESDYKPYVLDEWYCLLSNEERENLHTEIPETSPDDGQSQTWGGDAQGPLIVPPPLTDEEEDAMMNVWEQIDPADVDPEYRGGNKFSTSDSGLKRSKRQKDLVCDKKLFDLRKEWPKCREIISNIRNQRLLKCGACWAISTAAALTDRSCIFISKKRPWANFTLDVKRFASVRDVLECTKNHQNDKARQKYDRCEGGDAHKIWKYFYEKGTVNENCKPFHPDRPPREDWIERCHYGCDNSTKNGGSLDLLPWGNSFDGVVYKEDGVNENTWIGIKQHSGILYATTEFRSLWYNEDTERLMIEQLKTNGTITASYATSGANTAFLGKNRIYKGGCPADAKTTHSVRIIGFGFIQCKTGTEKFLRQKFWLVANSYGPTWNPGDEPGWEGGNGDGTFYIQRGTNECKIESRPAWGTFEAFPFRKQEGNDKRNTKE